MLTGFSRYSPRTTFALALLLVLAPPPPAGAASGDLDTAFDGDGRVVRSLGGSGFVTAVALQADNKILVAGGSQGNFAVARFTVAGALDPTFGTGGIATTDFGGSLDHARALAVQPDGQIVAAGVVGDAISTDFAVARYNPDGTLDPTFSGDGRLTGTYGAADATANAVAIAADGKIVIAGASIGAARTFGVAQLNPDGSFDAAFSGDGRLTRNFGGNDSAAAIAITPDGTILVAGGASGDFGLVRFSSLGLEIPFAGTGPNGAPVTDFFRGNDIARAMALQQDGRIVVAGQTITELLPRNFAVARYNPDGSLDPTFSGDGLRPLNVGANANGMAVAVQLDGKIVVAGHTDTPPIQFVVARLHPDGSLDTSFSGDGLQQTSFGSGSAFLNAVLLQRIDGRILAAGSFDGSAALARYHAIACNNRDVTAIGTNGNDVLFGRVVIDPRRLVAVHLPDVIHGMGGSDTIDGLGADDHICGGAGNDTLIGGLGNDTLHGGPGSDSHDGGSGTDVCVGGGLTFPADTFTGCETVNSGFSGLSGDWRSLVAYCNRSVPRPSCFLVGTISVSNPGTESTSVPAVIAYFLSQDAVLDEDDTLLETATIGALGAGEEQEIRLHALVPGASDLSDRFVIAYLDATDVIPERNEENNIVPQEISRR